MWNTDGELDRSIVSMSHLPQVITALRLCKEILLFLGNTPEAPGAKGDDVIHGVSNGSE